MPPQTPTKQNPTFVLCFDFDGTLAHPSQDPAFHPRMLEYLKVLRRAGAVWVVNSGRGLLSLLEGFAQNGVFHQPDYIVANEYEIYKPTSMNRWENFGKWNKQVFRDQKRFHRTHRKTLQDLQQWVSSNTGGDMLMDEGGGWGVVTPSVMDMDRVCDRIHEVRDGGLPDLGYQRNGRHLRFSHSAYSKGVALTELCRMLEVPSARTFAGGDNHNDLTMLDREVALYRACPSNSVPEVKEALRRSGGYVASQDGCLGMMQALRYFFRENLDEEGITTAGRDPVVESDLHHE